MRGLLHVPVFLLSGPESVVSRMVEVEEWRREGEALVERCRKQASNVAVPTPRS